MAIYKSAFKCKLCRGNCCPAQLYKENQEITNCRNGIFNGQNLSIHNTFLSRPKEIFIYGGYEPSKNIFNVLEIADKYSETGKITVSQNAVKLKQYANSTNITPEKFLNLTNLSEGEIFWTFHTKEIVCGTTNEFSGRIVFLAKADNVPNFVLTQNGTKKKCTVPENFNSDNYSVMYLYGCKNTDESGNMEFIMKDLMITKDASADFSPWERPTYPTLTWNGEEIVVPYLLAKDTGDIIHFGGTTDPDRVMLYRKFSTDISETEFGRKILKLKTKPKLTTACISQGSLSVTALISE